MGTCPCMEINVSVQYNGGLLPDIMLSTSFSSDCCVNWTQVAPSRRSAEAFSDLLKLFRRGTDGVYLFSAHMQAMASIPSGYLARE